MTNSVPLTRVLRFFPEQLLLVDVCLQCIPEGCFVLYRFSEILTQTAVFSLILKCIETNEGQTNLENVENVFDRTKCQTLVCIVSTLS